MAAESAALDHKRRVSYHDLAARSYDTRVASARVPFRWQINPYRGCEFGCKYCYARYTHEFMELHDPEEFERRIYVKAFDAGRFRAELRKLPVGETLAIGTATEPYQPAERRYRVTRRAIRGTDLHPRRHLVVASCERRRFQELDHSPGQHDASAVERR